MIKSLVYNFNIYKYMNLDSIIKNPLEVGSIQELITDILNFAIGAAAVICVVMLIAAGYSYITAGGDETKVEKATKSLTNAIIGLAICFIAVLLVNFVLDDILQAKETTSALLLMLA